ncbi:MAG: hypothetical protein QW597_04765 [Thermoplasmataceae archaeon]
METRESDDYHKMLTRIDSINRYRSLIALQDEIWKMHSKYPFSVYANIKGRLAEKIRLFESPNCDNVSMKIIFINATWVNLEKGDCTAAQQKGMKLPDYMAIKYPHAVDFEIPQDALKGTATVKDGETQQQTGSSGQEFSIAIEVLQTRLEYLIRIVDHMESLYTAAIPRISENIKEINVKLDELYRRLDSFKQS